VLLAFYDFPAEHWDHRKRRLGHTFRTDICSVSLRFDLNRKA
jgi:hypothetical protein